MKRALLLLAVAALGSPPVEAPQVTRAALMTMEKVFDSRIERLSIEDPFDLLGSTRGVYLEGYGAVLTAEANLVIGPVITPFRPTVTKEEIARLHAKKQQRLPVLKQAMREMLADAAASLDAVPPNEQIVVAVSLFYFSWEERTGLPGQILMQAQRQALVNRKLGRLSAADLDSAIQTKEF